MTDQEKIYHILHLEDQEQDAELVKHVLKGHPWEADINHVKSGEAFEEAIKLHVYDAVLLDFSIPNYDVMQAIETVKQRDPYAPVIIVSGAVGEEAVAKLLSIGLTDYVMKDKLHRLGDVVSRAVNESRSRREKDEFSLLYEQFNRTLPAGFYKMNEEGGCAYVNNELSKMLQVPPSHLLDEGWVNSVHEDDRERVKKEWGRCFHDNQEFELELRLSKPDGSWFWALTRAMPSTETHPSNYFGIIIDISKLKETELRLKELSYYDPLTNLPNRRFLQEELDKKLSMAKRYHEEFAIFYVDLDDFKKINDTRGHTFGDVFLEKVGQRFKEVVRKHDFISRIGGDEFCVIVEKYQGDRELVMLAERIQKAFSEPFMIDGESLHSSVSIGVAVYPDAGDSGELLLQYADSALYRAKSAGRGGYKFFNADIQLQLESQVDIENKLRSAIANNELHLVYQPLIYADTHRLGGYEVLLRWENSDLGPVKPSDFIPIAESSGVMHEIGMWVFRESLKQHKIWLKKYDGLFEKSLLSINVSPAQILSEVATNELMHEIQDAKLPPHTVMLEITETAYIHNPELLRKTLNEISALGTSIAVDDFGTGYSSLNIVEKLPINMLKIDTNFVINMFSDPHNIAIIKAVVALSKNLDFKIVAEGVETDRQAKALTEIGCDYLQGFYFSKPLEVDAMDAYIQNHLN